jgi:hypothetical protein
MSIHGTRKSTIGLGHDGKRLQTYDGCPSHPDAIPKIASGMRDVTNVHAAMGKAPQPKHAHLMSPPVHGGMIATSRRTGQSVMGSGQDLSMFDGDPGNPLGGAPRGKRLTPPQPSFGQRSRRNDALAGAGAGVDDARNRGRGVDVDLARRIMGEALTSSNDHAQREYGIGVGLPQGTDEAT